MLSPLAGMQRVLRRCRCGSLGLRQQDFALTGASAATSNAGSYKQTIAPTHIRSKYRRNQSISTYTTSTTIYTTGNDIMAQRSREGRIVEALNSLVGQLTPRYDGEHPDDFVERRADAYALATSILESQCAPAVVADR